MKKFKEFYKKLPKSLTTITPFSKVIALFMFIFLPLIFFYYGLNLGLNFNYFNNSDKGKACTLEAKLCSDGSYVGRTGPNCEFTKCPEESKDPSIVPTCKPRPACLDQVPRCLIPETPDMCPPNKSDLTPSPTNSRSPVVGNGCKISGCSGEICQDASKEPLASICIYKEEYGCYKNSRCEKQVDGQCGWTKTSELTACINNSN